MNLGISMNQNITGLIIIAVIQAVVTKMPPGVMLVKMSGSAVLYRVCRRNLVYEVLIRFLKMLPSKTKNRWSAE